MVQADLAMSAESVIAVVAAALVALIFFTMVIL